MPFKRNNEKIKVIASVIAKNSKYLICRRPSNKRHGGLWEFPGGKIQDSESNLDAARRELSEELGVGVADIGRHLFTAMDPGSPYLIEFVEIFIVGEPKAIEHSQIRWCERSDLTRLLFAPADTRFVKEYLLKENQ